MSRLRPVPTAVVLAGMLALSGACNGPAPAAAPADPVVAALPGPDDVDGSLTRMVPAERWPVVLRDTDPAKGAEAPLVTIISYSDFECPFCGGFATTLDELVRAYPDDVRIVFRHFPLGMHPGAEPAARAAIAAQAQGRFWAMHDRLFAVHRVADTDGLVTLAKELGLDTERFSADLAAEATAKRVADEQAEARGFGVRSTPSFFINGRLAKGALPPERLRKIVDTERGYAQQLIDAGAKRNEVYAHFMRAALAQHPE